MKLYYETHSTSVDNERGIASGHIDVPLSDLGRAQAAELGTRYTNREVAAIYTSDLFRAITTAEIAFKDRTVPCIGDRRLRECDYGTWSGCSIDQMNEARHSFIDVPFPNGESFRDVVRRVEQFLGVLTHENGPILVIAHRAPWYALEHLLKGRDLAEVVAAPWSWQPGWVYEL